jgi:hypothetical protein
MASDNREPTNFCDADACLSCDLAEGEPTCLRRKADFCLRLAVMTSSGGLRAALEKLALDLMNDSDALKKEKAALFTAHNHRRGDGRDLLSWVSRVTL